MSKAGVVNITFYGHFPKIFNQNISEIDSDTVPNIRALLNVLCDTGKSRARVFDKNGKVRKDIAIFHNGRSIYLFDGLDTKLQQGDSVTIFTLAFSG